MKVEFVETMRGTLRDSEGSESKVEFEVHAEAEHLRGFLRDGHTRLKGILRAAPYADEVSATGELTIAPLRSLAYLLTFESNGVRYRLEGEKHPSLLQPLRSMTEMDVVLRTEAGAELARGQMRFAIKELGGFLASWLPFYAAPRVSLDVRRRMIERATMSAAGK
jgi:hypothetical protein